MPGRRGERRRPVTALTTGRWAATLLTLALLSPLAGVAHGSGEPAPAPSRARSHPARTSTRRARRDTRARCPSCAEGWSPGASTRSTTRWCCATTRWRRTPPPRRTPRSARAPPSSAPGSYSSTATGTPPRTPRPPRERGAHKKRQSTQPPSTTAELYTPRTPSSPKPSELGDYTTPRRRPCASSGTSAPSGPRARRCEPRGDPTTCTSFERKPASRWTSTRRFGKTSRGRSRSDHNPQTPYEP